MPAVSQAQQRFMAMAEHGKIPLPPGLSRAQARDFARTPRRGLPERAGPRRAARGGRIGLPPLTAPPIARFAGGGATSDPAALTRQIAHQYFGDSPVADVFFRMMQQESGNFDPDVISGRRVSSAGALGIAQFMPGTAQALGVNPLDPVDALNGAARYLAGLINSFGGDVAKGVAAYNAGPGNVSSAVARGGGDWVSYLPAETRTYLAITKPYAAVGSGVDAGGGGGGGGGGGATPKYPGSVDQAQEIVNQLLSSIQEKIKQRSDLQQQLLQTDPKDDKKITQLMIAIGQLDDQINSDRQAVATLLPATATVQAQARTPTATEIINARSAAVRGAIESTSASMDAVTRMLDTATKAAGANQSTALEVLKQNWTEVNQAVDDALAKNQLDLATANAIKETVIAQQAAEVARASEVLARAKFISDTDLKRIQLQLPPGTDYEPLFEPNSAMNQAMAQLGINPTVIRAKQVPESWLDPMAALAQANVSPGIPSQPDFTPVVRDIQRIQRNVSDVVVPQPQTITMGSGPGQVPFVPVPGMEQIQPYLASLAQLGQASIAGLDALNGAATPPAAASAGTGAGAGAGAGTGTGAGAGAAGPGPMGTPEQIARRQAARGTPLDVAPGPPVGTAPIAQPGSDSGSGGGLAGVWHFIVGGRHISIPNPLHALGTINRAIAAGLAGGTGGGDTVPVETSGAATE